MYVLLVKTFELANIVYHLDYPIHVKNFKIKGMFIQFVTDLSQCSSHRIIIHATPEGLIHTSYV